MKLKSGVKARGVSPELLIGILAAQEVYRRAGTEFVITSLTDGQHMQGSLHYKGDAADLRSRDLKNAQVTAQEIRDALGPDYDVVVEGDHIHMEYDAKT